MVTTQSEQNTTQAQGDGTPQGGEPSSVSKETSPQKTPQTYTKETEAKAVQAALMKAGRDWKTLETERDTLKATLTAKETELEDIGVERESLEKKIDDLASGDPERFNLVKKDRELRERERKVKTETQALEADKQVHSDRLTRIETVERDISILEIVDDYETADPEKLTDLAETLGAKTKEQISKIADSLWAKKAGEPATPSITVDSGVTSGGAEDFSNLSPREKIDKGIEKIKKK